jgi:hypothetical protein
VEPILHSYRSPQRTTIDHYTGETFMSFGLYFFGFLIFIAGVAWALVTAGVPILYVAIASVILLGIGIMTAVSRTRPRDPPST